MKLKVCGMKFPNNISEVSKLKPDFIGFIFYKKSPRYIGDDFEMPANIEAGILKTGVFVNEEIDGIESAVIKHDLQAVQLHGDEDVDFVGRLRTLLGKDIRIIKAFGISEDLDFEKLIPFDNYVDYFLFDTKTPAYGGSGQRFNWEILEKYKQDKPFFLSGGIGFTEAGLIKEFSHPQFYAIDVNSGFETEAGSKDIELLTRFKKELFS